MTDRITVGVGAARAVAGARLQAVALSMRETRGLIALWPLRALLQRGLEIAGLGQRLRPRDRRVLEDRVLRHLAAVSMRQHILSVGVRAYTRHHEALLAPHRLSTIDIDPAVAHHGSSQHHVVASVCDADRHFTAASVDAVVMNGVFGWGLDTRADLDAALIGLHRVLRPGGLLVIGWNDVALRRPFPLASAVALRRFEPHCIAALGGTALVLGGPNRHRFDFFAKPR